MSERVQCPVCGTETRRGRFPRHFADTHPRDALQETFGYSAFWAALLPALALCLGVAQTALVALNQPGPGALRETVATRFDIYAEGVPAFLAFVVAPVTGVALGTLVVALARGPGQAFRRGWQPRRYEVLLVALWLVPMVGPGVYLLGAGRRFVSVRFLRERLAAAGFVASDELADAERALATYEAGAAADAFDAAGTLVQGLRDDAHFRNPAIGAHLDALAHGCGMAAAISEHQHTDAQSHTDARAHTDGGTTST